MSITANSKQPGIQMTLFDYFMDSEYFTLNEAVEVVKKVKEVKEPSVRGRIYEGVEKGLFERVSKGVYTVKKTIDNHENTCLLINGDGRNLSMLADNSIDCIITDHPYKLNNSLKGGNRDFAQYELFNYEQKDFEEKFRVLKNGCFLVEFLPEENSDNFKYLFKIKEMAEKAGLNYYTSVDWKKGDFVANTGRKAKNTENIVFFTKGKCRELRLDAKKNKEMILERTVAMIKKEYNYFFGDDESETMEMELFVKKNDLGRVYKLVDEAWDNWMCNECENSPLLDKYEQEELLQIPVMDYVKMYLEKYEVDYIDLTGHVPEYELCGATNEKIIALMTKCLLEVSPEKLNYMSGANGMFPTQFDVEPVKKSKKIHQAEKPVELIHEILEYVTLPDERVLDQFAGSGVVGEASIDAGRDSILIEKDESTYNKMVERMKNCSTNCFEVNVQDSDICIRKNKSR